MCGCVVTGKALGQECVGCEGRIRMCPCVAGILCSLPLATVVATVSRMWSVSLGQVLS